MLSFARRPAAGRGVGGEDLGGRQVVGLDHAARAGGAHGERRRDAPEPVAARADVLGAPGDVAAAGRSAGAVAAERDLDRRARPAGAGLRRGDRARAVDLAAEGVERDPSLLLASKRLLIATCVAEAETKSWTSAAITMPRIASTTSISGSVNPSSPVSRRRALTAPPLPGRAPRSVDQPESRQLGFVDDRRGARPAAASLDGAGLLGALEQDEEVVAVRWRRSPRSRARRARRARGRSAPSAASACRRTRRRRSRPGISSARFSRISSSMRLLVTITSTAATRPPSTLRQEPLADDAAEHAGEDRAHLAVLDRPGRTRSSGGPSRRRRSCASSRARDARTRPPGARSRPSRCRAARRSGSRRGPAGARGAAPARRSAVSSPTSRWLTMQLSSAWRISIGSSIVTMC